MFYGFCNAERQFVVKLVVLKDFIQFDGLNKCFLISDDFDKSEEKVNKLCESNQVVLNLNYVADTRSFSLNNNSSRDIKTKHRREIRFNLLKYLINSSFMLRFRSRPVAE